VLAFAPALLETLQSRGREICVEAIDRYISAQITRSWSNHSSDSPSNVVWRVLEKNINGWVSIRKRIACQGGITGSTRTRTWLALMSTHFPPEVLEAFDALVWGAFKADLFLVLQSLYSRWCLCRCWYEAGLDLDVSVPPDTGFMVAFDNVSTTRMRLKCNGFKFEFGWSGWLHLFWFPSSPLIFISSVYLFLIIVLCSPVEMSR
jgi:hypothetical protein